MYVRTLVCTFVCVFLCMYAWICMSIPERSKFSQEFDLAIWEFLNFRMCQSWNFYLCIDFNYFNLLKSTGLLLILSSSKVHVAVSIQGWQLLRCNKLTIRPFSEFTRCHLSKLSWVVSLSEAALIDYFILSQC